MGKRDAFHESDTHAYGLVEQGRAVVQGREPGS